MWIRIWLASAWLTLATFCQVSLSLPYLTRTMSVNWVGRDQAANGKQQRPDEQVAGDRM